MNFKVTLLVAASLFAVNCDAMLARIPTGMVSSSNFSNALCRGFATAVQKNKSADINSVVKEARKLPHERQFIRDEEIVNHIERPGYNFKRIYIGASVWALLLSIGGSVATSLFAPEYSWIANIFLAVATLNGGIAGPATLT